MARQVCTKNQPKPPNALGHWLHPDAECIGECIHGCCDDYRCPNCGQEWREEVAD